MSTQFGRIDFIGKAKIQELMCGIHDMCSPVTQGSHSEIVPAAPLPVVIVLVEFMWSGLRRPKIPIHSRRNGLSRREFIDIGIPTMPSSTAIHMRGHSSHILDDSGVHPGFKLEIIRFGVTLITHLGGQFWILLCCLNHQIHLLECACHRFLHIHMLTFFECHHGHWEM